MFDSVIPALSPHCCNQLRDLYNNQEKGSSLMFPRGVYLGEFRWEMGRSLENILSFVRKTSRGPHSSCDHLDSPCWSRVSIRDKGPIPNNLYPSRLTFARYVRIRGRSPKEGKPPQNSDEDAR